MLAFGGLQWGDVELDRGRIPVRRQPYGESGEFRAPKTKSGVRFVPLLPRVTSELRGHANVAVTLSVYTHWVESHASSDHTSKLEA